MDVWPPLPTEPYPPLPPLPCPLDDPGFGCPFCDEGVGYAADIEESALMCPETLEEETQQQEEEETEVEPPPKQENKLLELWYITPLLSEMRLPR
jgi:hypothetical protein